MFSIYCKRLSGMAIAAAFILSAAPAMAVEEGISPFTVGGAIRFNYVYKSWQEDYSNGFFGLDTARLDVKYDDGVVIGSAQYRYNNFPKGQGDYSQHFLHHGWVGVRFADKSTLHVGVDKNQFGLQPFASNNFYESMAFYVGFEDKYDLGVTYASKPGPVEWQVGFYPRDGGSYGGSSNTSGASNRYSYNIVADDDAQGYGTGQRDTERNTLIGRLAVKIGETGLHEVGVSALTGTIRNEARADGVINTRRNAFAVHFKGNAGPVNVMLQAMRYDYNTSHAAGQTYGGLDANSFVMVGGFGYPYPVATKGDIYIANLSYDIAGKIGPFGGFKVYNDYSVLRKRVANYGSSMQNVTGMSFSAGKWYFYADYMVGKNHPYMSPDFGGLASPSNVRPGHAHRINLQAGYYF
jgi:hypothetical protein